MQVNIVSIEGYSDTETDKAKMILTKVGEIISSPEFKDAVLNFSTPLAGRTFFYRPWQQKYSNQEVYDIIMQAAEDPGNVTNGVMDLYLVLEDGGDGTVIGYGNPGEKEIHTYRTSFAQFEDVEYAAHITHEWTHKLGFVHDFHEMPRRKYSVPYGIQDIMMRLYQ